MSSPTDILAEVGPEPRAGAPARLMRTWPFYWSVRREIWEHRELYLAPLIAAGVVLFGVALGVLHPPHATEVTVGGGATGETQMHLHGFMPPPATPHLIAAGVIFVTTFFVSVFYCLGALNNERRDRSILFWKSLPVSDLTTVLSKAVIPLVVAPVVTYAVIAATQLVILAISATGPVITPVGQMEFWRQLTVPWLLRMEAYLLAMSPFWYAPIWGWLLLISAWSRRGTFLWGFGPPLALCVVEKLAFGTSYVWSALSERVGGLFSMALTLPPHAEHTPVLPLPDPVGFFSDIRTWAGLVFAALCLAAAVWLRRRREPM